MKKVMLTFLAISFICGTIHPIAGDNTIVASPSFDSEQNFEAMITSLQDRESVFKQVGKWFVNNSAIVAGSTLTTSVVAESMLTTSIVLAPFLGAPVALVVYLILKYKSPYYKYKWAKNIFVELGKEYQRTFKNTSYDAVQNAFVAFSGQNPHMHLILYAQDIGEKLRLLDAAVAALTHAQDYSYQDKKFLNDCIQLTDAIQQLKAQYFDQMKIVQENKLYAQQLEIYAEEKQARYQQRMRQQELRREAWDRFLDRQALVQAVQAPAARAAA